MSISESIISIFEKLSTQKIAAPAALASFILLLPTFIWILLLKSEQIFRARSSSTFSELTSKLTSIFATNTPPELSRTATILSVIFVTSLSFLVINFVRDVKDALKQLAQLELRGKRYNRDTELEVRPWTGTLTVCLNYRT